MQFKLKKILIIVAVILTLGLAYKYYKKAKDTGKLKTGELTLKPENKIDTLGELVNVFKNGLLLKGNIQVKNLSSQDYTISHPICIFCMPSRKHSVYIIQQ